MCSLASCSDVVTFHNNTYVFPAIRCDDDDDVTPSNGARFVKVNMAAAYREFENQQLPIVKKEFPNLKLSQIQQKIRKNWSKSPSNPLNQAR